MKRKPRRKRKLGKWLKSSPLSRENRECVEHIVDSLLALDGPFDVHSLDDQVESEKENNRAYDINNIIDNIDQSYYDMMDELRTLCRESGYKHPHLNGR